ncbi:low temperature requirement protein A [Plantactinospora sp. B5E13]|uniref:low temperature requirement protein A n=1 Tax=unclassified Plantactinospora TaxID=2631981 RepID=UPI00325F4436
MAEGDRERMSPPGLASTSRPALLELFFDLAYVAAMITLTERLLADLTPLGAAEALVLLVPFALLWALTSWGAGDTVDLNRWTHVPQFVWARRASW